LGQRRAVLGRVLASPALRRVQLAFFLFVAAEYGAWVAVLVYAYQRGGATLAGLIAVVQLIPAAITAPLAARSVDRRGAGAVLVGGYAVQALALSATAAALLLGLSSPVVYVGAVVTASAVTLIRPAQSALLPSLVTRPSDLTAANAVTGWVESISVLTGPALAGVGIAVGGPGVALALFAAALIAAAIVGNPLGRSDLRTLPGIAEEATEIGGVVPLLRTNRAVSALLVLVGIEFVAIGAMDVVQVVLAVNVLALGPAAAGYLGAAFGAGGVIGATGSIGLVGGRQLTGVLLAAAALSGAAFMTLGVWPTVAGAFALIAAFGLGRAVFDVAGRTLLHRVVPASVHGRVFGALEGISMVGLAVGSIAAPALIHIGGAEAALVGVGAAMVLAVLAASPTIKGAEQAVPVRAAELAALHRSPLFGSLAPPVLEDLARALRPHHADEGEVIVREGELGQVFYLVDEGTLEVSRGGRPINTLHPGAGFGEIALLQEGTRTATVTARTRSHLYALGREPFLEAVTGSYQLHHAVHELARSRSDALQSPAKRA
jgi:MFS family permease